MSSLTGTGDMHLFVLVHHNASVFILQEKISVKGTFFCIFFLAGGILRMTFRANYLAQKHKFSKKKDNSEASQFPNFKNPSSPKLFIIMSP